MNSLYLNLRYEQLILEHKNCNIKTIERNMNCKQANEFKYSSVLQPANQNSQQVKLIVTVLEQKPHRHTATNPKNL